MNKIPDIKYDFKFKYLVGFCQSRQFSPPIGMSSGEKIVAYVIEGKYAYLFNRFWFGTGWMFKFLLTAALAVTAYAFFCLFKVHLKI